MMIPFSFKRGLLICAALGGILTAGQIANAESGSGDAVVTRVTGQARISLDQKSWQKLKKGATLHDGALLQTASKSQVSILLGSPSEQGATQVIHSDSILSIDKVAGLNATPDVELDLRRGSLEGHVGHLPAGSRYEIKFSNGVIGARSGANFHFTAEGTVSVTSGEVVVVTISADGTPKTQTVSAGQQYNAATGALGGITSGNAAAEPKSGAEAAPTPTPKGPLRKF